MDHFQCKPHLHASQGDRVNEQKRRKHVAPTADVWAIDLFWSLTRLTAGNRRTFSLILP